MCDAGCDAGPLSSIVWANFLASGWFMHCYFLSCYFFSYLPTVSFFPVTLFILLPKWTVTLFLFFFSHLSTVTFFPVTFFPTWNCYFLSCFFFSHLSTVTFFPVTFFPVTFFPTWNCYFLSCYLFSCYFLSVHLGLYPGFFQYHQAWKNAISLSSWQFRCDTSSWKMLAHITYQPYVITCKCQLKLNLNIS